MTKQHDELLACPFCGGEAEMFIGVVTCKGCGASIQKDGRISSSRAAWNTRPAHPQAGEVVAWRCKLSGSDEWELCFLDPRRDTSDFDAVQPLCAHPQPHAEDDAELREGIARVIDGLAFGITGDPATDDRRSCQRSMALQQADSILKLISAARRDDQGGAPANQGEA